MKDLDGNPLLRDAELPAFSAIEPHHVQPAIDVLLERCRTAVADIHQLDETAGWDQVVPPLEEAQDRLHRAWSPVSHLHSVADSDELRDAYNEALLKLSAFHTDISQDAALFARYQRLAASDEAGGYSQSQKQLLKNALRDFELAGVGLPEQDKQIFKDNAAALARLCSQFEENVLDASNAWHKHVEDEAELAGLPPAIKEMTAGAARERGLSGWMLTLDIPCYLGVLTHAENRALRREVHEAYNTRASEIGPHGGRWDNSEVMASILGLRQRQARALGFANYAELSLARKMAPDTGAVLEFLNNLAARARAAAERELSELAEFAREELGLPELESHDLAYCTEQLRQSRYNLSQEELRPYFPMPGVLEGLFEVIRRLFDVQLEPAREAADVWHPDVRLYDVREPGGERIGRVYLDLYARARKRGGAWMDECVVRRRRGNDIQLPVAYVTCNFTPPPPSGPSLLSHDEVTTLFHEFGHALHHLLSRVDHGPVSGINGVAWDAVELPSQLLENWCWDSEALGVISGHVETGEPLPPELLKRLKATQTFQSGLQTLRQLEFALFDFRIHLEFEPEHAGQISEVLDSVRDAVAVAPAAPYSRFAHGFSHIFGGGYAAGYYSYKWAEALSADAFEQFEQAGIFDAGTGAAFKRHVLEQGGSRDAMELFVAFKGREPGIEALLRQSGFLTGKPESVPA